MPDSARSFSGAYPLENRDCEIARLRIQSDAMAPEAAALFAVIGVQEGWHCVDVGCGPVGVADILSGLVGAGGSVLGLDMNAAFLDEASARLVPGNVTFRQGDAYRTGLPDNSFDLVHMRFLASTAGAPEQLLEEALRIVKPGGVIALQEPDGSTLQCYPPHPAWDQLKAALLGAFAGVGADLTLANRLYSVVLEAGPRDVRYRTSLLAVRSCDAMVDYLPATVESLRSTVVRLGLLGEDELDRALSECRAHLSRPGTSFTMYTLAQVWGRKGVAV